MADIEPTALPEAAPGSSDNAGANPTVKKKKNKKKKKKKPTGNGQTESGAAGGEQGLPVASNDTDAATSSGNDADITEDISASKKRRNRRKKKKNAAANGGKAAGSENRENLAVAVENGAQPSDQKQGDDGGEEAPKKSRRQRQREKKQAAAAATNAGKEVQSNNSGDVANQNLVDSKSTEDQNNGDKNKNGDGLSVDYQGDISESQRRKLRRERQKERNEQSQETANGEGATAEEQPKQQTNEAKAPLTKSTAKPIREIPEPGKKIEVVEKKTSGTFPAPHSAKNAPKSTSIGEPATAKPEKIEVEPRTNPPTNATINAEKKSVSRPTPVPAKAQVAEKASAAYNDDNDGSEEKCDCAACTIM